MRLGSLARISAVLAAAVIPGACDRARASQDVDIDALPPLSLHQEARIGSVDDPEIGFSRPYMVDVDIDGNLYVAEAQDRHIRVYDRNGTRVRTFGGAGSGPGEFESSPSFGVVGDTVWAYDTFARRITLFDRDGSLLSARASSDLAVPLWGGSVGYIVPWRMLPNGLFIGELARVSYSSDNPSANVADSDTIPVPRVLFDATGTVVDTIGWDPSPPPRMARKPGTSKESYKTITIGSRPHSVPMPPAELPHWFPLKDGRIILEQPLPQAENAVFTVNRLDLARDTVYNTTLHYKAGRYTDEDLDSLAARSARGGGVTVIGGPQRPIPADVEAVKNQLRGAMSFPEFRMPIRYGWLDSDERLWLQRDEPEGPAARFIVIDRTGAPMGTAELPTNVRLLWSRGDVLWASVPDDNDVPWLVRYRIGRAPD